MSDLQDVTTSLKILVTMLCAITLVLYGAWMLGINLGRTLASADLAYLRKAALGALIVAIAYCIGETGDALIKAQQALR